MPRRVPSLWIDVACFCSTGQGGASVARNGEISGGGVRTRVQGEGERLGEDRGGLVRGGDLHTYKIHLGSINILDAPGRQLLVYRPGAALRGRQGVFLQFGDDRLSQILGKAFRPVADSEITDASILTQLKRGAGWTP
ncbi:DUF7737 domain-containing protein [Streptomyces sviceus]